MPTCTLFTDVFDTRNSMRSGSLLAPSPPYTMAQLRAEAQYFGIELPGAGAAAADGGAVAEAEPQGDMLVLHVFGGATTNNFVKAVQLDIYGPLSKSCSNRIAGGQAAAHRWRVMLTDAMQRFSIRLISGKRMFSSCPSSSARPLCMPSSCALGKPAHRVCARVLAWLTRARARVRAVLILALCIRCAQY